MARRRFNNSWSNPCQVKEPVKGEYIVEEDTLLTPRQILYKYSLGLPVDGVLVQDSEYYLPPDDLTDFIPNAGEEADDVPKPSLRKEGFGNENRQKSSADASKGSSEADADAKPAE